MESKIKATEEQRAYAWLLDWGMKIGLAVLVVSFAMYLAGVVKPYVPVENLVSGDWRLPIHGHVHGADVDHAHAGQVAGEALLLIENVGNLVCPAMWDLGERAKVAILSVTEGEDKPLKYPDMFAAAHLMVLNKIDLLPHLDFDVAQCIAHARRVNPAIEVLQVSARTGEGLDAWIDWLLEPAPTA